MPQLESRLLIVTDRRQTGGRPLVSLLCQVLSAGTPGIQLRERDLPARNLVSLAREVLAMTAASKSQLIINDRVDVALTLNEVGVHLRSNSLPVSVARRLLGPQRLLGVSVHSVEEASRAGAEGADYAVFGPVYETASKREFGPPLGLSLLEQACRRATIPIVAIGGVTAARVREVRCAGAFGVAVIGAIFGADDVAAATRGLIGAVTAP